LCASNVWSHQTNKSPSDQGPLAAQAAAARANLNARVDKELQNRSKYLDARYRRKQMFSRAL
jgi:hypothetical protein